jgi:hypothetical protein
MAVLDTGIYKHSDLNVAGGYNRMSTDRSVWTDGVGSRPLFEDGSAAWARAPAPCSATQDSRGRIRVRRGAFVPPLTAGLPLFSIFP